MSAGVEDSPDADDLEARSAHIAGAIYGEIVTLATVVALSENDDLGAGHVLVGTVGTVLVFWLAHAYSELISTRVAEARTLPVAELRALLAHEWPIVQAAGPAAVVLALAWLGACSLDAAVNAALALGILSLLGWGVVAARRSGHAWPGALVVGALDAALGVGIVVLKVLLGH